MQSIIICFVSVFMLLCSVEGSLHECGEFNQHGVLSQAAKLDTESILIDNVLGDFFNAVNNNDTRRMEEFYNIMEDITAEKTEKSFNSDKLLKFVVKF